MPVVASLIVKPTISVLLSSPFSAVMMVPDPLDDKIVLDDPFVERIDTHLPPKSSDCW